MKKQLILAFPPVFAQATLCIPGFSAAKIEKNLQGYFSKRLKRSSIASTKPVGFESKKKAIYSFYRQLYDKIIYMRLPCVFHPLLILSIMFTDFKDLTTSKHNK